MKPVRGIGAVNRAAGLMGKKIERLSTRGERLYASEYDQLVGRPSR